MLSYRRFANHGNVPLTPTVLNQEWNITGTERAEYIEVLGSQRHNARGQAGSINEVASCWYGVLNGDEILDWVTQRGKYAPPKPQAPNTTSIAGIRLLILERDYYQPPSFRIKQETYQAIEKHFSLPKDGLLALAHESGMSSHAIDVDEKSGELRRLSMIIKAHQKFQVGNYGLTFSYDFATNMTTGILHGTGVTQDGDDYGLWSACPAAEIYEHMKAARRLWTHPLCLPAIVMQHHLLRTDYFVTVTLGNQHTKVQHQLGVVRAGRLALEQPRNIAADMPVQQAKVNLAELTVTMSGLMFDVVWYCGVADCQCACMKLLLEVLVELEGMSGARSHEMGAKVRYLASLAEGIKRQTIGMKENGQADMSVLHSIISQVDNRLNARLAAASSHDSAAMKTLAFLTALFLPGTFVATIFSTDFFDWQPENDGGMVVSELFWVFWAFAVPLTVVVAVGWRLWWSFEKKRFDEDIKAEIKAIDGSGNSH
ncbi:hypothetical protein F5B22DRAFT_627119 [Xylaria bambusicola]|uniref:uncharacterized protein n=1 Tax=Xylaria bambusicola TaxID=326684 RepID=UPI002008E27C|nr:uncharacterized protein F5B22DRAFT_627119 [Xylaria bambusicola]KAI0505610.1 hypothetical protein F5B22DRAFT_627119 [Xylaria bambusicola]